MAAPRIVLCTLGTLGDLHPYVALALGLRQRGWQPVVATSAMYREKVEREGLEFAAVRPDLAELGDRREVMARAMHRWRGPGYVIRHVAMRHLRAAHTDLLAAAAGAQLIVSHLLTYAAPVVAEQLAIPWVGTALQPLILLSATDPPVFGPLERLSRWPFGPRAQRVLQRMVKGALRSWGRPVVQLRRELGLPRSAHHPLFESIFSPLLNLALFSPHFAPPQADWPTPMIACGFPFYDSGMEPEHARLSPALSAFLDAGKPPVVFTLGSSAVTAAGSFFSESFRAATREGLRAVLLVGDDERNRPSGTIPAHICVEPYAPYSLLLPRAASVVHQGGIGTTAQCLKAGTPQLVVPFSHDQPDNAQRVRRLGCGQVLTVGRYRAETAIAALRELQKPELVRSAAEFGKRIASEDGVATACAELEKLLDQLSSR
jgi:rhamnosyltransferase subunit B